MGGWCFAVGAGPGGLAAVSTLFLFSVAILACVGSSIVLSFRRTKTRAEWVAMVGGYLYPGILGAMMFLTMVTYAK